MPSNPTICETIHQHLPLRLLPGIFCSCKDFINVRIFANIISLFRPARVVGIASMPFNPQTRASLFSWDGVAGGVGIPSDTVDAAGEEVFDENIVDGASFQWCSIVPD